MKCGFTREDEDAAFLKWRADASSNTGPRVILSEAKNLLAGEASIAGEILRFAQSL